MGDSHVIGDPRVGPVDIRVDKRTKRQVVGQLPTQDWGWEDKTGKKKKKKEKEAACGFLWSELGTYSRRGGAGSHGGVLGLTSGGGLGTMGQSLGGQDPARQKGPERGPCLSLEKLRFAGSSAPQWPHAGGGPQPFPVSSCHLGCSLHLYTGSMGTQAAFGPG